MLSMRGCAVCIQGMTRCFTRSAMLCVMGFIVQWGEENGLHDRHEGISSIFFDHRFMLSHAHIHATGCLFLFTEFFHGKAVFGCLFFFGHGLFGCAADEEEEKESEEGKMESREEGFHSERGKKIGRAS